MIGKALCFLKCLVRNDCPLKIRGKELFSIMVVLITGHVSAQDISAKWSKVTQNEAAAIRNVDSLSTQVQKSYGLDKAKADAEVKQFMGARTF